MYLPNTDYKPMPPHPMLCSTCILMLGKIQPMRDVFPAISTSFDQIYLSGTVRYCAICSTFAEAVKKPASSLHVIHQDWKSSIRENREPKELILGFIVDVSGVLGGSVVRSSGEPLIFCEYQLFSFSIHFSFSFLSLAQWLIANPSDSPTKQTKSHVEFCRGKQNRAQVR